jgi:hypothetical protein
MGAGGAGKGESMSRFHKRSFAFVAMLVGAALTAGAACAETAVKPQKNGSSVVTIANSRDVTLTELDATPKGLFVPRTIARNIGAGKIASVNVPTDKDCIFDLHGIYSDGSTSDSKSVDLCKDKSVNLVN